MTDWSTLWATVAVGLVVVFVVLIFLVVLAKLFSVIVAGATSSVNKRRQKKERDKLGESKISSEQAEVVSPAAGELAVTGGGGDNIGGEVIAAISAAIAMISEDDGVKYTLKSVKRARKSRPDWNMAGISDNTRAF